MGSVRQRCKFHKEDPHIVIICRRIVFLAGLALSFDSYTILIPTWRWPMQFHGAIYKENPQANNYSTICYPHFGAAHT